MEQQNNNRGNNEIRNNVQQNNNAATVKMETETKATVLGQAGEFASKHKEALIVAGVLTAGYMLRKPIAKAATWTWKNTLGRLFTKKKEDAPAASTEAKEEQPAK